MWQLYVSGASQPQASAILASTPAQVDDLLIPELSQQVAAGIKVANAVLTNGIVGTTALVNIAMQGHANSGHVATGSLPNDFITVTVSATS